MQEKICQPFLKAIIHLRISWSDFLFISIKIVVNIKIMTLMCL